MTSPLTNQIDFFPMEEEDILVEIIEETQERSSETLKDLLFEPQKYFPEESGQMEEDAELPEVMNVSKGTTSILDSDSGMFFGVDLDPSPTVPPFAPPAPGILPNDFPQDPSDFVPDPIASPTSDFIFDESPEDDSTDGFPLSELEQRENDAN